MVPHSGVRTGMHVISVEKTIPATSESVSIEHISYWLDKDNVAILLKLWLIQTSGF